MNQYLPYEETFARKMESLPLPDRQDAIWQAVQLQIATPVPDAPGNDTGLSQQAAVSTGKIITGFIITVIIVAVTIIVASRKKKVVQNLKSVPEIIQPQAPVNDSSQRPEHKKNATVTFIKADTVAAIPPKINIDTSAIINPVFPVLLMPDSNRLRPPIILPKDTIAKPPVTQPNKKNIGVQGISDSSYRISGKKDST